MDLLLDANALPWAAAAPDRLAVRAREAISDPANRRILSTVAVWECATKATTGRLSFEPGLAAWIEEQVAALALTVLPVELRHCLAYAHLPFDPLHRDPFDRMLIAQATAEGMAIVSSDPALRSYGVEVIW
jgi:PIN domain nuclease of toxin-antitoxin system